MPLSKLNQELHADLIGAAADMKWFAVDLLRIAERLNLAGNEVDAQAVMRITMTFVGNEERLNAYADEVKLGFIKRDKA